MSKHHQNDEAGQRKKDHIELTFSSQVMDNNADPRFNYEPLLGDLKKVELKSEFLGTTFDHPIWISSMTGGAEKAQTININLAKLCKKYGLGMGLGSCRQLLYDDKHLDDFDMRKHIGDRPLFANLGIAQLEMLVEGKQTCKITEIIDKLNADGLIIHVNPMQEFMQPEGDKLQHSPITTIKRILDAIPTKIIIKEVGQGMGFESLKSLLTLPIAAIETAAYGGSNFAKLELLRQKNEYAGQFSGFINVGHNAGEMVENINFLKEELKKEVLCNNIIISGGIKSFLDGYYYIEKINMSSVYGMASQFLKYALISYDVLDQFTEFHIEGLKMSKAFLRVKKN
jgi:isopentenyl-diphosphate delta-isomerase